MALCEMCGKDSSLVEVDVEGVELGVCSNCSKYGQVKTKVRTVSSFSSSPKLGFEKKERPSYQVVDNYSSLIRKARELQGMNHEEFSKLLNERESVISKWEQGILKPSIVSAKLLSKKLGVNLVEREIETSVEIEKRKKVNDGFTLGDFIKVRKRK